MTGDGAETGGAEASGDEAAARLVKAWLASAERGPAMERIREEVAEHVRVHGLVGERDEKVVAARQSAREIRAWLNAGWLADVEAHRRINDLLWHVTALVRLLEGDASAAQGRETP